MTCQHCQTQNCETQILDDDYRCRRCGSRVRSTPLRPAANRFPVEAAATARAYERSDEIDYATDYHVVDPPIITEPQGAEQKRLFEGSGNDAKVIAFDSLTTRAERQSIQARAAGLSRPAPLKTERVQVKHAGPLPGRAAGRAQGNRARLAEARLRDQRLLEFDGQEETLAQPRPSIICDAPVAPARLRLKATVIDGLIISVPCCFALCLYWFAGGSVSGDKYVLPVLFLALATIPLFYKFLWTFANRDSIGLTRAGLQLVDFDGNPPSQSRRYQRLLGSLLSLLAAGIGLVWSLLDEDRLTWHDHISNTFPTFESEE